jgi:hypothetical protein
LGACATNPKHEKTIEGTAGSAFGQWHGKALIVTGEKAGPKRSSTIDLQIVAQEPRSLRVDAMGPFGVQLMSMATDGKRIQILFPREKKFLENGGDKTPGAVGLPNLPGKVTPEELLAILFERPLDDQTGWECNRTGAADIVYSCFDKTRSARVIRRKADGDQRRFEFSDSVSSAELVLYEAKAKVEMSNKIFELKSPNGFRKELLR